MIAPRSLIVAAAALAGALAAAAPTAAATSKCPESKDFRAKTSQVQLFVKQMRAGSRKRPYLYGCNRRTGATRRLGWYGTDATETRIGREAFALAGRYVSFVETHSYDFKGTDDGQRLVVVDLVARATVFRSAAFEQRLSVYANVLKPNGSVAWISGEPGGEYVRAHTAAGDAVLDSDPSFTIHPGFLPLTGDTVSWRHAGALRSAPLG